MINNSEFTLEMLTEKLQEMQLRGEANTDEYITLSDLCFILAIDEERNKKVR